MFGAPCRERVVGFSLADIIELRRLWGRRYETREKQRIALCGFNVFAAAIREVDSEVVQISFETP